jgi:NAD(P)-dependent dehydrogenase (short-subunit alcohol dehydrogenase family)
MSGAQKTAIVTGASQGIGAGIVNAFALRGFNVIANSRKMTQSTEVAASEHVALVFQLRALHQRDCLQQLGVRDAGTLASVLALIDQLIR